MCLLAFELYLKNRENVEEIGKSVVPIKKIFVKVTNDVIVKLDSKTLEHYGVTLDPNGSSFSFQESLAMPPNNLSSVGLPNKGTGANSKKPYIELYGVYDKNKLKLSIAGKGKEQKETYAYEYNFESNKEAINTQSDLLVLRLDADSYFVDDTLLFDVYRDSNIVTSEGALSFKVFTEVCRAFVSFWKEKIVFEELKKFSRFPSFRIVILPFSLLQQGKIEYRNDEENSEGESFEDCFGNLATDYPSKPTINAKFFSFDDEAFTINCKTGKDFYQNLGISNVSFPKINLPPDRLIRIAGLEWYFFDLSNASIDFADKGSGIYDQLLNNYNVLSEKPGVSAQKNASLKIICAKRAQAKIEVLLDENLTLEQMKGIFERAPDGLKWHPSALEILIVENSNRDIIWTDYITAIRHFMNGTYFDRAVLVQRFTYILRKKFWDWLKGKRTEGFFDKSQFCLSLLTIKEKGSTMDKNEEYAYKIGIIAGKYVKFKRDKNEANNSTKDILTYSKYDRERLRFVYNRVGLGLSLSKVSTDDINQFIKNNTPKDEIDDTSAYVDYSYFFYKGVFENST